MTTRKNIAKNLKTMFWRLIIFSVALSVIYAAPKSPVQAAQNDPALARRVFLPLMLSKQAQQQQLILGVYTMGYLGDIKTINDEVKSVDTWSGKRLSLVGTYIAIEDQYADYNITVPLGNIWDNGYTPFVNLSTQHTLSDINSGKLDTAAHQMAQAFKHWRSIGQSKGQNRRAFVAPLQEMNGYWVPYHGSPADFKLAFKRIEQIFSDEQASAAVRWVFAPNGWSSPNDYQLEDYYPGDGQVEAVALSAYNFGYCSAATWKTWQGPDEVFGPYLDRLVKMAPTKPIFVAQTGTTAYGPTGYNEATKGQWIYDSYSYLAQSPNVFAIIYFNRDKECDWAFYQKSGRKIDGYKTVVAQPEFGSISPSDLANGPVHP